MVARLACHALFAVLLSSLPVSAQETTGTLEGRVVDPKGEPVAYVNVVVTSPTLQGARGTQTDQQGRFVLLALAVGEYSLKLSHLAYQTRELEHIPIRLGQTTALGELSLQEQVYTQKEVVVSARPALVDPHSTAVGENLSASDYQALPVDRDYKSLAVLLPHANISTLGDPVNFAGATGLENRYFVDGIDVTDPYRSATGTRLPYNFIEEVQVRTGGYEAENRSSLGGTVNAITFSGGNRMTGQVFGFYTSNAFSATPRSVPGSRSGGQNFALYDLGFGLGGPIRKDALWYSVAYNPAFSTEDVAIPGWGSYEDRSTAHSFAGKLTWRATPKHTLVLTALGDPTHGRSVTQPPLVPPTNIDPYLNTIQQGGSSVVLEGRSILRDNLLIQASVSRSSRHEDSNPESERGRTEVFFVDSTGTPGGGGTLTNNTSTVTMAALHATWIGGDQEVKTGVEYRDTRLDFDNRNGILIGSPGPSYYIQVSTFQGHVGSRLPSLFLQHSWRPNPRLQVNDGIRWDGQYWISSEGHVAQTILDEWQPRLGITFQPGRLGTQKIYASVGRFYQDLTTAPLFWYYNRGSQYFAASYNHDPRADPSGADTIAYLGGSIQQRLTGLEGQYYDELNVGYERQLNPRLKFGARGLLHFLRKGIEDGIDLNTGVAGISNPGLYALRDFPPMDRRYSALELSGQGQVGRGGTWFVSYVLSRNVGNYEGLFDSRLNNPFPNVTGLYDVIYQMQNAGGPLPNDHTHVFKIAGSERLSAGVTVGAVGTVENGAPVSEFGGTPVGPPYYGFIQARGARGRTPTIWDLNLRIGYEPSWLSGGPVHPRVTADIFHLASQRKVLRYDEVHYRSLDASGNQADPNPDYGKPISFQAPTAVRVGLQMDF